MRRCASLLGFPIYAYISACPPSPRSDGVSDLFFKSDAVFQTCLSTNMCSKFHRFCNIPRNGTSFSSRCELRLLGGLQKTSRHKVNILNALITKLFYSWAFTPITVNSGYWATKTLIN